MTLYEIVTFSVGESYVRAYAWAESEEQARQLFAARNPMHSIRQVRRLLDLESLPYCTAACDDGWE